MSDPTIETRVPRSLDEPMRILWLDFPQAMVVLLCIGVGTIFGSLMAGAGIGLGLSYAYGRLRAGRHPMCPVHLLYWHLPPVALRFRATPPSHVRRYRG